MTRTRTALDHDVTWLALLGATALVGGRRSRRAALRGLISLSLAGLASGSLRLSSRSTGGTAAGRHSSHRLPVAAAAFAAAAAVEAPALAVPVAGVLAVTAVESARRSAPEVTNGLLLGAAAAVASLGLWPRSPMTPAEAESHHTRRSERPSPTGGGLVVVCNAAAGSSTHRREIAEIERALPDTEIVQVDEAQEIAVAMHDAAGRARSLGVIGGDGTISSAAHAALEAGIPLLVLPGGTLNHFARDLGIGDATDAISALRSGEAVEVDVGVIDGRVFLNTASFGTYSEFVEAREQYERRIGKWPAVLVALWRTVLRCEPLDVTINGHRRRIWTIFVGNCEYHPPGFAPATRRRLDDGRFDVRIIDGTHPAARFRLVLAVLTGRVGRSAVYTRELLDRIEIAAEANRTTLAADGEIFEGNGSFTIAKHERALVVYARHR